MDGIALHSLYCLLFRNNYWHNYFKVLIKVYWRLSTVYSAVQSSLWCVLGTMRDSKTWAVQETFLSQVSTSSTSISSTNSGAGPDGEGGTTEYG